MNKPTPGPWKIGLYKDGKVNIDAPAAPIPWEGLARVQVKVDLRIDPEGDANAALIVAAVNACFAINPSNPQAVAEALPELVKACRESAACLYELSGNGVAHIQIGPPWAMLAIALAKLEAK